jgi:hypothetical protein
MVGHLLAGQNAEVRDEWRLAADRQFRQPAQAQLPARVHRASCALRFVDELADRVSGLQALLGTCLVAHARRRVLDAIRVERQQ